MPLSFLYDKGDDGLQGDYGVWNHLLNGKDDAPIAEDAEGANTGHAFQWTRPRHRWLALDDRGLPVRGFSVPVENTMHVGLHYSRRSSREGALYSQSSLPRGTKFEACVHGTESLPANRPELLFLGKRRSSGNGEATLRFVERDSDPWWQTAALPAKGDICLQLMSDSIVPDVATGGYLTGLGAGFWKSFCNAELRSAHSASLSVQGWSGAWGLPRQASVAVAAGSVFRLGIGPDTDVVKLRRLTTGGLGLRTQEGFGWVVIDPPWLLQGRGSRLRGEKAPELDNVSPLPLSWPGVALERSAQVRLAKLARDLSPRLERHAPKIAELAMRVSRSGVAHGVSYLTAMASRPNPHKWEEFDGVLRGVNVPAMEREEMSFLLDALAGLVRNRNRR